MTRVLSAKRCAGIKNGPVIRLYEVVSSDGRVLNSYGYEDQARISASAKPGAWVRAIWHQVGRASAGIEESAK